MGAAGEHVSDSVVLIDAVPGPCADQRYMVSHALRFSLLLKQSAAWALSHDHEADIWLDCQQPGKDTHQLVQILL